MNSLVEVLASRKYLTDVAFTELGRGGTEVASLTYQQLLVKASAVAARLQSASLANANVILALPHDLDFIVGFFGCLLAGCSAIPQRLPKASEVERFRVVQRLTAPAAVLTTRSQVERVSAALDSSLHAQLIEVDSIEDSAAQRWSVPQIGADSPALVQFSSGTTNTPKGAVISHGALMSNCEAIKTAFGFNGGEVVVSWLPFTHDMGLIGHIVQPVYTGQRNVFMSPLTFALDPTLWLKAVAHYRADCSGAPTFAYRLCCERITADKAQGLDLSSWRVAYCGAERIDAGTLERFAARFAAQNFRKESLFPCYGLAESTLYVAGRRGLKVHAARDGHAACVCVGGAGVKDADLRVVEVDSHAACAPGDVGEIWIRSSSSATSYYGDATLTAETFDAVLEGRTGYVRTGDLGFLLDAELYVVGRIKDLIKVRGLAYAAEDIEAAARMGADNSGLVVGACAAIGIEHADGERVVLVLECDIQVQGAAAPSTDAIKRTVCDVTGLLLDEVRFASKGALPRTASGKVRRNACRLALEAL